MQWDTSNVKEVIADMVDTLPRMEQRLVLLGRPALLVAKR
jgi:hypothetical protein